ncbi:MAG: hypothetical protein VXZ35_00725, partial [Pseudomonadota bacterium]|nr:hypothetical protein [Pseudomonadota bacterium]
KQMLRPKPLKKRKQSKRKLQRAKKQLLNKMKQIKPLLKLPLKLLHQRNNHHLSQSSCKNPQNQKILKVQ